MVPSGVGVARRALQEIRQFEDSEYLLIWLHLAPVIAFQSHCYPGLSLTVACLTVACLTVACLTVACHLQWPVLQWPVLQWPVTYSGLLVLFVCTYTGFSSLSYVCTPVSYSDCGSLNLWSPWYTVHNKLADNTTFLTSHKIIKTKLYVGCF